MYDDRHQLNKHAGERSTDEVNKNETVLNNSCQFKILAHTLNRNRSSQDITEVYDVTDKESFNNVKAWMGEIDKHVSDSVNEILIESKRDLTSQEELSTDEAKELADSLRRATRVRRVIVPRRSTSRGPAQNLLYKLTVDELVDLTKAKSWIEKVLS